MTIDRRGRDGGARLRALAAGLAAWAGLALAPAWPGTAQAEGRQNTGGQTPTGWELSALPALNYDSDEGFGYGVLSELYDYGDGTLSPYRLTIRPRIFFTTEGRRDGILFVDAPHVLGAGWRFTLSAGIEKHVATPYYGLGNASEYDPELETDSNPYFYRFGRTRGYASVDLQRSLGLDHLRVLAGARGSHTSVTEVPKGEGTTFLADELDGSPPPEGWTNGLRAGLVWDSRDRQVGPTRGTWSELLVQGNPEWLGSESGFVRWTITDRRYLPLGPTLVLAQRILLQGVEGGTAPFHELFLVQSSFEQQEGLGGAKTVRGLLKNRFVGEGMFLLNLELRWSAASFSLLGKPSALVLSGFVDRGRVWEDGIVFGEMLQDSHSGFGGGARIRRGESFTVAFDIGHSEEAGWPFYIGLGYLF